jgi:hypothetical protein
LSKLLQLNTVAQNCGRLLQFSCNCPKQLITHRFHPFLTTINASLFLTDKLVSEKRRSRHFSSKLQVYKLQEGKTFIGSIPGDVSAGDADQEVSELSEDVGRRQEREQPELGPI